MSMFLFSYSVVNAVVFVAYIAYIAAISTTITGFFFLSQIFFSRASRKVPPPLLVAGPLNDVFFLLCCECCCFRCLHCLYCCYCYYNYWFWCFFAIVDFSLYMYFFVVTEMVVSLLLFVSFFVCCLISVVVVHWSFYVYQCSWLYVLSVQEVVKIWVTTSWTYSLWILIMNALLLRRIGGIYLRGNQIKKVDEKVSFCMSKMSCSFL